MFIYMITNTQNNKKYIGRTTRQVQIRWKEHLKMARKGDTRYLYCAIRHYGEECFQVTVLDSATSVTELCQKEAYYVDLYHTDIDGYNMMAGGDVNPMEVDLVKERHDCKMRTPAVRAKISQSMLAYKKAHPVSAETSAKLTQHNLGRICMHRGNELRRVKAEDAPKLLAEGFVKGSLPRRADLVLKTAAARRKRVYCVNRQGEEVARFDSVRSAAKWWYDSGYHVKHATDLCNKIKRSAVKGLYIRELRWFYENA